MWLAHSSRTPSFGGLLIANVNRAPAQELLLTLTTSGATQAQGVLCLWHQDR